MKPVAPVIPMFTSAPRYIDNAINYINAGGKTTLRMRIAESRAAQL
jgi:hypothetical protein